MKRIFLGFSLLVFFSYGIALAEDCTYNSDCASGNCNNGTCEELNQEAPTNTNSKPESTKSLKNQTLLNPKRLICSTKLKCPLGICSNGKTYQKYSCINGQCLPLQYFLNPCPR